MYESDNGPPKAWSVTKTLLNPLLELIFLGAFCRMMFHAVMPGFVTAGEKIDSISSSARGVCSENIALTGKE